MPETRSAKLCLCAWALFSSACAAGWNHTSDAALQRNFERHRAGFEALLVEIQADARLASIQRQTLIYDGRIVEVSGGLSEIERAGLPKERWIRYQKELQNLGLIGVWKGPGSVEFRVDPGWLTNGDSYKGYEFMETPPDRVIASLDGYRIADRDKDRYGNHTVHRRLAGNWYLYLFVNS